MNRRVGSLLLLGTLLLTGCGGRTGAAPLDRERLRQDMTYLCGEIGPRAAGSPEEREAADWLEEQLEAAGFSAEGGTLHRTAFSGLKGLESENLIAICNQDKETILCVVAHYDSVEGCPGARDNAASVAVLLALARALGPEDRELDAQVRFLFPGSEENGYHGSAAYVAALSGEERARHRAVFNLDISAASPDAGAQLVCTTMGGAVEGEYREGNFLEPAENTASRAISAAFQKLGEGESVPVLHWGESDHVSFHDAEIEAANVCWRALDGNLPVLPKEYHRPEDTPDTLDCDTARLTGECVLAALRQLGRTGEG